MRPGIACCLLGAALVALARPAASDPAACADAFEAAQLHRKQADFARARSELSRCQALCPSELRQDCSRWNAELDRDRPSVTLSARNERGQRLSGVQVSIDGARRSELPGTPIALDPGRYRIRFVHPDQRTIDQTVTLAPREQREVVVVFARSTPPERPPDERASGGPALPWVLGAIGTAAVGVGIGLGIKGRLDLDELEETCSPNCTEEQADGVRRTWAAAAVTGTAGGALLITSIVLLLTADDREASPSSPKLGAAAFGIGPAVGWSF